MGVKVINKVNQENIFELKDMFFFFQSERAHQKLCAVVDDSPTVRQ